MHVPGTGKASRWRLPGKTGELALGSLRSAYTVGSVTARMATHMLSNFGTNRAKQTRHAFTQLATVQLMIS